MTDIFNTSKNFGFGFMRLPMIDGEIDYEEVNKMVDYFIDNGFNYFDTAHGYLNGKSELALKKCVTSRYPRDKYIITDKLSTHFFNKREEIRPLLLKQLEACGVSYFDLYLMHSQDKVIYEKYKRLKAYEEALEFKKEGLIKHFGISFHDKASVLEEILKEYPEIEVVQIQFNYIDYDDPSVESKKCYDVCVKYNKPVIVMEPVKGGTLVNLPDEARDILLDLNGGSIASYAIRFAASFPMVKMVLSGMSDLDMIRDNVGFMKDFKPLTTSEFEAIEKVRNVFKSLNLIPCTACKYCVEDCPKNIPIPDLFACLNYKEHFNYWNTDFYYKIITSKGIKASDCIKCGKCEHMCPQHLKIRDLLVQVTNTFER